MLPAGVLVHRSCKSLLILLLSFFFVLVCVGCFNFFRRDGEKNEILLEVGKALSLPSFGQRVGIVQLGNVCAFVGRILLVCE
jgi:hypothetical protein